MNVQSTASPGTRINSAIAGISTVKLSGGNGTLQNLVVTETGGAAAFVILHEGTGDDGPATDDSFVFAFPVAANGVTHLQMPIRFTGGLWLALRATTALASSEGEGVFVANFS